MQDQGFEEWLESLPGGSFTREELKELGAGTRHATEIDVRMLVREVLFLRGLTKRLYDRCRELGEVDSALMDYARLAIEGVRPDET